MNRMTTPNSQLTTSKTALVSPSHEQFIPERMKKVNLFAKTLGVLVLILASSLGVFGQTITDGSFLSDVTFSAASNTTSGGTIHSGTVVADFDGDGKTDVARVSSSNAEVFHNIHSGVTISASSFASPVSLSTSSNPANIYTSDIDGDGKIDIVVTANNNIDVFFNTSTSGSISFSAIQTIAAPNSIARLVFADFTGDGLDDIAGVAQYGSSTITLLPNTSTSGSLSVGTSSNISIGATIFDFALIDVDLDGDNDVFGIYTGTAYFVPNLGGAFGSVQTQSYSIAPGSYSARHSVGFADLNNDNKFDIFATQADALYVFTNNTTGSFSFSSLTFDSYAYSASGFSLNLIASDFNGDGKKEILIPSSNSGSNICFTNTSTNGGSVSFSSPNYLGSSTIQTIRSADIDGDGKNDIIQHTYFSSNFMVRQNFVVSASVAASPTSLSNFSTCAGTASTSQTTSVSGSGLTADLVVTAPSGYEVSTDDVTYSNSLSFPHSNGTVAATTVYVRLAAGTAAGTYNANLTVTSTGASTTNVALTGVVNANPVLTITDPAAVCSPATVDLTAAAITTGSTGTFTLTYWTDAAATTALASPASAAAGIYYIKAETVDGCFDIEPVTVTVNAPISSVVIAVDDRPCGNTATGSATVTLTGGAAPFTYAWTRNGAAFTATPANAPTNLTAVSSPGYVVTVTDACGSSTSNSITLSVAPSLTLNSAVLGSNALCTSGNGTIVGVIQGGSSPRTLTATNTTNNTLVYSTFTPTGAPAAGQFEYTLNVPAGTYSVSASDGISSCVSTSNTLITVTEPVAITSSIAQTDVCFGGSDGSITITASGGTGTLQYSIDGGATYQASNSFTGLSANAYSVVVQDGNNCTTTPASVTINQSGSALAVAVTTSTDVACNGASTGAIDITASGGYSSSYTYSWSGPATFTASAEDLTLLSAGTYNVTVTDAGGCTEQATATITEPTAITATVVATDVDCNGTSTGAIAINGATGGVAPYNYSIDGTNFTNTTGSFTGLTAVNYDVQISDASGCIVDLDAGTNTTISEPPVLSASAAFTNVLCNGESTGTISVSPSGGTGSYQYSIDGGTTWGSTSPISNLAADTYTVTVEDDNGCQTTVNGIVINEPTALSATISAQTNNTCNGESLGSATVSVTGGTGPYTYSGAGPNGAVTPTPVNTTGESNNPSLPGWYTMIGQLQDPFTQVWNQTQSAGQTFTSIGGQLASVETHIAGVDVGGNFAFTIYDGAGNTGTLLSQQTVAINASGYLTITLPTPLTLVAGQQYTFVFSGTQVTARLSLTSNVYNGGGEFASNSNGTTIVNGTGTDVWFVNTYTIPGDATVSSLEAGVYVITIQDANGCTETATATITEPTAITATVVATDVDCNGTSTGAIAVNGATGGTGSYQYSIDGGTTWGSTSTFSNLAAATYDVQIRDVSSFPPFGTGSNAGVNDPWSSTYWQSFTPASTALLTAVEIFIEGQNGSPATVTPMTGTLNIYSGTGTGGTLLATQSISLTQIINVFNSNLLTLSTPINVNAGMVYTYEIIASANLGVLLTNFNNSNDYVGGTYSGNSNHDAAFTIYSINPSSSCIVDLDGVSNTAIAEPTALTATAVQTNVACFGDATGTVTATAAGGTAPYTYSLNGGNYQSSNVFAALVAGTYTVTVKDANNCTVSATAVTVTEPAAALTAGDDGISDASCSNILDGAIPITASGGTAPYTYAWTGPNGFTSSLEDHLFNLAAGTYSVTVTDVNTCQFMLSNLVVNAPAPVALALASSTDATCYQGTDGAIDVSATGGTTPYGYSWTKDGVNLNLPVSTQDLTNIGAGTYVLTLTDGNFCQQTLPAVTITEGPQLVATVASAAAAICSGTNAVFTITGTAGQVVTYNFNGGTNATATIAAGGTATVTVTAATTAQTLNLVSVSNGSCSNTLSGTAAVTINALPTANAGSDQTVCAGTAVTLSGAGTGSYTWDNSVVDGVAFTTVNATLAAVTTTYTLTVTDANGCTATDLVDVTVNVSPTLTAVNNQTVCTGAQTNSVAFTDNLTGTTYAWTNDTPSIGLAASASGNIAAFTAINAGAAPVSATISFTGSNSGCTSVPTTFTITVNPIPTVDAITDQSVCAGATNAAVVPTGAVTGTNYDWTNTNTAIGLSAASGTGTIPSFTALNAGLSDINSTITVTPSFGGNMGTVFGATNENGSLVLNAPAGTYFTGVQFASYGTPTGTLGNYNIGSCHAANSSTVVSNLAIGQTTVTIPATDATFGDPCSGTSKSLAVVLTYGTFGSVCTGTSETYTITVNPSPVINPITTTICSGTAFTAAPSGSDVVPAGTTYTWTVAQNANVTGASNQTTASATISQTLTNTSNTMESVIYTVTPGPAIAPLTTVTNNLWGRLVTYTNVDLNGQGNSLTIAPGSNVNISYAFSVSLSGSVYCPGCVVQSYIGIGGTSSTVQCINPIFNGSSGNFIGTFTAPNTPGVYYLTQSGTLDYVCQPQNFINNPSTAIAVVYVGVTPNQCSGAPFTVTVDVDPTPSVTTQTETVCSGIAFSVAPTDGSGNIVPAGTTYTWSAPAAITGISGLAAGTAQATIGGTLINSTAAPINVTYVVTPTSGSCSGTPFNVVVTVNPTPAVSNMTATICSGTAFTAAPVNVTDGVVPTGTTYTWTVAANANVTGETSVSTASNNISQTLNNATVSAEVVTYTVTPTANSCPGSTFTVAVTVNPIPVIADAAPTICSGSSFTVAPVNGTDLVPTGTTYTWTVAANANVTGESAVATAQNSISQNLVNTTSAVETVVYTVTPTFSGCDGATFEITVTVNPTPSVAAQTNTACSGELLTFAPVNGGSNFVPVGTTYTWTVVDNPNVIGETNANTAQTSIAQTLVNNYTSAQQVVYTVTPTFNGCAGTPFTYTVTVSTPVAVAALTGATNVCIGATTQLASATTGGVWISSNTAVATISATGVVTGLTTGTTTISYTVTNSAGCTGVVTANVNVNALPVATVIPSGATSFCDGGSVTLTASAGDSYMWSNGLQTASISVTTAGNYSVQVTNAAGCSATSAPFAVTLSPLPVATITAGGPLTFCQGGSVALTAGGGVSYTWSNSTSTAATLTVNTSGVYTVTATDANGCTATSAPVTVTVNALPVVAATAGSNDVCVGSTTTLTNATTGGVWSSSNNATATVSASGVVTGIAAGNATINYTVTNVSGCITTSALVMIVNAVPTVAAITGANNVCVGATSTWDNATTGGVWSSSNVSVAAVAQNGIISGVGAGTATISYTITNALGCATTVTKVVTVDALPIPTVVANGPLTFCEGGSVVLTADGGTSYVWSSSAAVTPAITVTTSGTYTVTATNANGCFATSAPVVVDVLSLPNALIASSGSNICLGSTTTLTASGGVSYAWSNGAQTASTTVNSANTYVVTVTGANGCVNTASNVVTVNPNPAVVVTASAPLTFCQGGAVTLNATGAAGIVWNDGTTGSSLTVTQSGTYYAQGTNQAGCTSNSAVFTVTVLPTPVVAALTGANSVCETSTISLSSATPGGVWSTSNSFIANVDNAGVITGMNAGTAVITYTLSNGACNTSVSASVTVLNSPATPVITAGGPTTVCPNETVQLFSSNASNYQWNSGPQTDNILVTQSGTYTVTVVGSNGCAVTSLPMTVTIGDDVAPIIVAPINVNVNSNLGCTAVGVALGSPVVSDNCAVASVTNDAPSLFPIGTTTVTWTVTDASGNTATASQLVNVVDQVAPEANAPADVTVNPNNFCEATGVDLGTPQATDNCTIASIVNDAPASFPIGTTVVTWTIKDAAGNFTTVTQNVTVVDTDAPVVVLQSAAVQLDANGFGVLTFEAIDNGSSDNCGIATVSIDQTTFDCDQVGFNTVSVTITDNSGNQSVGTVVINVIASDACGSDNVAGPNVPDAFTPNGNSVNDTWVIPGLEGYTTKQMAVYSRYGTLVYYSAAYANDWDGTLLGNGVAVPDGTYYYILNLDGGKQMAGYVYINRVKQ